VKEVGVEADKVGETAKETKDAAVAKTGDAKDTVTGTAGDIKGEADKATSAHQSEVAEAKDDVEAVGPCGVSVARPRGSLVRVQATATTAPTVRAEAGTKIKFITARQIIDSGGNPTVEVDLVTDKCYRSAVYNKAFAGIYEALESDYVQDYEYVAIFDADFQPNSDFLKLMVPHFRDNPERALVQARWWFVNEDENLLTRLQNINLSFHFEGGQHDTAGAAKGKVEDAAGAAKEKFSDKAVGAGQDLEGSVKSASKDACGEVENLGNKAQSAIDDTGDSLKRNTDKATSFAKDAGKDLQSDAEDVGDSAKDTVDVKDIKEPVAALQKILAEEGATSEAAVEEAALVAEGEELPTAMELEVYAIEAESIPEI
jgi:hypothetical protein